MSFIFRAGTSLQSVPFSASTTANLLSEGSALYSAQQIAEQLDFYGSYYDVSVDRDYAVVSFVCLTKFFARTLEIAREILLMPSFREDELAIYAGRNRQRLALDRSKVSYKARELFAATLFGKGHPYGEFSSEKLYSRLTRGDLQEFYRRRYTAGNCFVVCSGKIDAAARESIAALAGEIPAGGDTLQPHMPEPRALRSAFGAHKGAVQSALRIGRVLFPRSHPDYISMQVVTTLLGGYFGSRLVRNLRGEHGYTYGIFAGMVNLEYAGYMAVSAEVASSATEDAVAQIFLEIDKLRRDPVDRQELDMVRNIMTGEIMRVLDGPFGIADLTIENIQNGTDNHYLEHLIEQIRSITPEQVRDTAQKYLAGEDFTTVIVGDESLAGRFG